MVNLFGVHHCDEGGGKVEVSPTICLRDTL